VKEPAPLAAGHHHRRACPRGTPRARGPRRRRRPSGPPAGRAPLVLTGLALLAALGIAELSQRAAETEAARAEADRARTAVVLELSGGTSQSTSYDAVTDSVAFVSLLRVRNAGQEEITITAVELPGVQLLAPATVGVGRERGLTLRGQQSCADDPAALADLDSLPLEVRTSTGAVGGPGARGGRYSTATRSAAPADSPDRLELTGQGRGRTSTSGSRAS
jgi:hypothetical protein